MDMWIGPEVGWGSPLIISAERECEVAGSTCDLFTTLSQEWSTYISPPTLSRQVLSPRMDDLAHHPRKRKQDQDDVQDSLTDQSLATKDPSSSSATNRNAPRRLNTSAEKPIWSAHAPPTPTSPTSHSPIITSPDEARPAITQHRTPKRPRITTPDSPLKHYSYPSPSSPVPLGSDTDDPGSVPPGYTGPLSSSPSRAPKTTYLIKDHTMANVPTRPGIPVVALATSPTSAKPGHVPPNQPSINRASLRELELDIILRNPMIRTLRSGYLCVQELTGCIL